MMASPSVLRMPWLFACIMLSIKMNQAIERTMYVNKKAELFKQYLDERQIDAFLIDDNSHDELDTAIFRSHIEIHGNELPTIVVLDASMYGMIRVLVVPNAIHDDNETAVLKLINTYNKQFKSFKYYIDDDGDLMMDVCMLWRDNQVDGDMIYAMFNVIVEHLNESYQEIMKTIWQ